MNLKFILFCAVQLLMIGSVLANNEAKITFKSKHNSYYAKTEIRAGNSFAIFKNANGDNTGTIPEEICNSSLLWVCVDGAYSWLKVSPKENIVVWEENGKIINESSTNQQINNYLSDWTKMAYYDIKNRLLYRIDGMISTMSRIQRENPTDEDLLSDENLTKMETLYDRSLKQLKNAKIKDKKFVEQQKGRIAMQWIELYCHNLNTITDESKLPARAYDFIARINFDFPYADTYPGLTDITNYYFSILDEKNLIDYEVSNYLSTRAKKLKNQAVIEQYILSELFLIKSMGWTYRVNEVFTDVAPLMKSSEGREKFEKLKVDINKLENESANLIGEKCEDFEFTDRNGTMVKLSDFKGKYVFVDVWATWCSPCKYEIPYLLNLEKELHGKNIQFISLSVDKPEKKKDWLEYITKNEMNGICLISPDAFNHPLIKRYGINSIPRFLLFDKEGRTISIKNRRPHDLIMKKQLIDLLK